MKKQADLYFDYAATTPVDPKVVKSMQPYLTGDFGNSVSLHRFGQIAKQALEQSRQKIAKFLGAKIEEVIFTSSATESNNLAL